MDTLQDTQLRSTLHFIIMKIKNQKIIEATERELFLNWLKQELYYIMPFQHYVDAMKKVGVVIKENTNVS